MKKIVLQEAPLSEVLRFFADAYDGPVVMLDAFVDSHRGVVVYKLLSDEPEPTQAPDPHLTRESPERYGLGGTYG